MCIVPILRKWPASPKIVCPVHKPLDTPQCRDFIGESGGPSIKPPKKKVFQVGLKKKVFFPVQKKKIFTVN